MDIEKSMKVSELLEIEKILRTLKIMTIRSVSIMILLRIILFSGSEKQETDAGLIIMDTKRG